MYKLCGYYKNNDDAIEIIQNILSKSNNITLRVLDWFVTYFCRYKSKELFYIYLSYKLQLKSYSKKLFDPFCRGERISLKINKQTTLETTVGQLNFFKWVIDKQLLVAYEKHKSIIEYHMLKNGFKLKLSGRGRKRKQTLNISKNTSYTTSDTTSDTTSYTTSDTTSDLLDF